MGLLEHCWLLRFLSAPSCAGAHLISPYWFTGWRIVMPPPVPQCPFRLGRDHLVTAGKKSSLLSLMWQWTARQHCEFSCEQQGSWLLVATMHTLWLLSPGFLFVCFSHQNCSKPHRTICEACTEQDDQSHGCVYQHGARPLSAFTPPLSFFLLHFSFLSFLCSLSNSVFSPSWC